MIMLLTKLRSVTSSLCKLKQSTSLLLQQQNCKKSSFEEADLDKPYTFSKSEAGKWKAVYNRELPNPRVWYSPIVVSTSITIFLLYFCVLREENDLDELIYRPLPETIKGIDRVFPEFNFYKKPDFVKFHEDNVANERKK